MRSIIAFLQKYERPLATILFITGFVGDLLTFGLLDLSAVTLLFAGYVFIVMVTTIVAHASFNRPEQGLTRVIGALAPLAAQFTFGSLLSGFLIFFTKSAVLSVSWPFLIFLLILFFGNEVFRHYRDSLLFQVSLVYFSLYAFSLFAIPLMLGSLNRATFFQSTAAAICIFALYLLILLLTGRDRFRSSLKLIVSSTVVVTTIIIASYLGGLLPPIPLILKDGGVYHSIVRQDNQYVLRGEGHKAWWDPRMQVIHHVPGTPLYAYSAISAPSAFQAGVMHVWQHKEKGKWVTRSTIAFELSGGRTQGYRGYSLINTSDPGDWQVLVQTMDGQTIGKFRFVVENVSSEPALVTQ